MLCSLYIHQRQASSAILRPSCLQASRIGLLALRLFLSLALCASACASTSQVPLIPSSKASLLLDNNTLFPGPPSCLFPQHPHGKAPYVTIANGTRRQAMPVVHLHLSITPPWLSLKPMDLHACVQPCSELANTYSSNSLNPSPSPFPCIYPFLSVVRFSR